MKKPKGTKKSKAPKVETPVEPEKKPTARASGGYINPFAAYLNGIEVGLGSFEISFGHAPKKNDGLRERVANDLAAIHDALPDDWQGHVEVEPVPPELTDTYGVAFASARKNCKHENAYGTAYARGEYQCADCGKYFQRRGMFD